jgi:hypothetical protein
MSEQADLGAEIIAKLREVDETTLVFNPWGFGGRLTPEQSARFLDEMLRATSLDADVPQDIQRNFERLRKLFRYGLLEYEFFTAADDLAHLVLEGALRHRFISYYAKRVPVFIDGAAATLHASSFRECRELVGELRKKKHKIQLREGQRPEGLPTSLPHLWEWARRRRLLFGQRNVGVFGSITRIRNHVAHPEDYSLGDPFDAIRMLSDVAEIVNRLWGHDTDGGRLFPGPVARRHRCAALAPDRQSALTYGSLGLIPHEVSAADWEHAVFLAADAEELVDFAWGGAGGQRFRHEPGSQVTVYPIELVWGPGSHEELVAALDRFTDDGYVDAIEFLDRTFFVRVHNGVVELPRDAGDVEAFSGKDVEAIWYVLEADFPLEAFVWVRDELWLRDDVISHVTKVKSIVGDEAVKRYVVAGAS